ncbi:MAG: ketohydroxyglutarate aldolase [Thermoanaerobaculia bacterium]
MKVPVLVSIRDAHLPQMKQVVEACRAAGLDVEHALEQIGTISGSIEPGKIHDLARVAGVASVERAGGYDIGPPDGDVQ